MSTKNKNIIADFLAAAQHQQAVDEHVRQNGEDTRVALEQKMFVELGGSAALRVQETTDMERIVSHLLHYTETEVQPILTILNDLPADDDGCRFIVKHSISHSATYVMTLEVYYMRPDDVKKFSPLTSFLGVKNAFHIELSKPTDFFTSAVKITFLDYSRLETAAAMANAAKTYPVDSQDLRALIGSCVARIAPHRVADLMTVVDIPQAPESGIVQTALAQRLKQEGQRFKLSSHKKPRS